MERVGVLGSEDPAFEYQFYYCLAMVLTFSHSESQSLQLYNEANYTKQAGNTEYTGRGGG